MDTGSAHVEEGTLDIAGLHTVGTAKATHLAATLTGGTPTVSVDSGVATIQLQADAGASELQFLSYEAKDSGHPLGNVHGFVFNRPLTSEPIADVEFECGDPGAAAICEVEFGLAWHHEGDQPVQHTITYRIDSQASEQQTLLLAPWHVQIVMPPQTGGHYLFDLLHDASLLTNGDDNTISRFILRVGARSGALTSMTFRELTITSAKPSDLHEIEAVQGLALRYEGLFGLREPVGLEFGTWEGHVNGFLPRPIDDRDLEIFDVVQGVRTFLSVKDWTTRVHDRGGLVSLNHPFGPGTECGSQPPAECVVGTAQSLLDLNAYGVDLLEVGYINRGLPLRDHLDLWDILTANELLLYGTGTSDNHGVPWDRKRNYVTWVLSPSTEPPDLLDALKAGRTYFGNPKVWEGVFSLQVGDAYMGDRISNPGGTSLLEFQLDPWPASVEVYLVQGLLQPSMDVEYLHDRTPLIQGQAMSIDTSRPSFVRLEAYEALGDASKAAMFTNPVTMLPNPGSVSGVVFEDVNGDGVFGEDESPLMGARMILQSTGLNGVFESGGDDVFTHTWTNDSGAYSFTELSPGSYRVTSMKEKESSVSADAVLTSGSNPYNFILADREKLSALDFGYTHTQDTDNGEYPDNPNKDVDTTPITRPRDSNGDGLSDSDAIALRLNPNDPDGDTDGDGIADAVEVGRNVNTPPDNDLDGIIDALEPGASAADAGIARGLPLPSGDTVTIMTATGEMLSKVSAAAMADGPTGINFPFGSISYTTSSPIGDSVTVRMAFSTDLPRDLILYKVNNAGALTELPASIWTRVNPVTVDITLTDGNLLTDLDAVANGFIEDPVVLSAASLPPLTPGSEGAGGCVMNTAVDADPSFLLLLLALLGYSLKRSSAIVFDSSSCSKLACISPRPKRELPSGAGGGGNGIHLTKSPIHSLPAMESEREGW
jgi:hypothetical protein